MTLKDAIEIVEQEYTLSSDKMSYASPSEENAIKMIFEFAKLNQLMFNILDGRDE